MKSFVLPLLLLGAFAIGFAARRISSPNDITVATAADSRPSIEAAPADQEQGDTSMNADLGPDELLDLARQTSVL